eukprot:4242852-Pleurochrysis_carterae.AAC.2
MKSGPSWPDCWVWGWRAWRWCCVGCGGEGGAAATSASSRDWAEACAPRLEPDSLEEMSAA